MITYQVESITAKLDEFLELARKNGTEIYGENYNPDIASIVDLDRSHLIEYVTVRDEGKLVGYAVFLINMHPHMQDKAAAECTCMYILPEYRRLFPVLLREIKKFLSQYQHIDICIPTRLAKVMERAGFELTQYRYTLGG